MTVMNCPPFTDSGMRTRHKFTALYPFCPSFQHRIGGSRARFRLFWEERRGFGVGLSERAGSTSISSKLPTLRLRAKIILGFAVTLAISAASMGIAYLGFERVAAGVATYRNSVSEADLARNIDRELISYRALARYFVVTGKEEDGKAALAAEASLKDAIDQSMKGTTNPARRDQVARLAKEFQTFSKIFADILTAQAGQRAGDAKPAHARRHQPALQARRSRQQRRRSGAAGDRIRRQAGASTSFRPSRRSPTPSSSIPTMTVATSALARLKFVENCAERDIVDRRKDRPGPQGDHRAARGIPGSR